MSSSSSDDGTPSKESKVDVGVKKDIPESKMKIQMPKEISVNESNGETPRIQTINDSILQQVGSPGAPPPRGRKRDEDGGLLRPQPLTHLGSPSSEHFRRRSLKAKRINETLKAKGLEPSPIRGEEIESQESQEKKALFAGNEQEEDGGTDGSGEGNADQVDIPFPNQMYPIQHMPIFDPREMLQQRSGFPGSGRKRENPSDADEVEEGEVEIQMEEEEEPTTTHQKRPRDEEKDEEEKGRKKKKRKTE